MKAIRFHAYGEPAVLRADDIERPVPGAGQVLVKVAGTSFNPVDASFRAGFMQQAVPLELPHIPGVDVAGTVEALGDGVPGPAVGTAVFGFLPMNENGAAAEYALVPAATLTAAPASIPLADAAAVPAVALTARQAVHEHLAVQPGQRILINGAGGGVGNYAIQFAKQAGATVLATASPRSRDAVATAGPDQIIDHTTTDVIAAAGPVDAVLNLIRTDDATMAALVGLVKPGGVLVTTGSPATEDTDRKVRAVSMFVRSDAAQLADIARLIDAGTVTVDVRARYPLAELARVHERAAAGELGGKVVVTVP
jgi:NADPH:quinone reductase-like Zn-dependent oxidoreductase